MTAINGILRTALANGYAVTTKFVDHGDFGFAFRADVSKMEDGRRLLSLHAVGSSAESAENAAVDRALSAIGIEGFTMDVLEAPPPAPPAAEKAQPEPAADAQEPSEWVSPSDDLSVNAVLLGRPMAVPSEIEGPDGWNEAVKLFDAAVDKAEREEQLVALQVDNVRFLKAMKELDPAFHSDTLARVKQRREEIAAAGQAA